MGPGEGAPESRALGAELGPGVRPRGGEGSLLSLKAQGQGEAAGAGTAGRAGGPSWGLEACRGSPLSARGPGWRQRGRPRTQNPLTRAPESVPAGGDWPGDGVGGAMCAQLASPLSGPQAPPRGPVWASTKEAAHEDLSSTRAHQLISRAQMEKPASVERLGVGNDFFLEICGLRGEAEDSPGCC